MTIIVSKKIDATRERLLKEIDDKKNKELDKLRQKYASYDKAKGPTTFIAVICVTVVALYILIMDLFRVRTFWKSMIIKLFGRKTKREKSVKHSKEMSKKPEIKDIESLVNLEQDYYRFALKRRLEAKLDQFEKIKSKKRNKTK